jgi:hypothetical protein
MKQIGSVTVSIVDGDPSVVDRKTFGNTALELTGSECEDVRKWFLRVQSSKVTVTKKVDGPLYVAEIVSQSPIPDYFALSIGDLTGGRLKLLLRNGPMPSINVFKNNLDLQVEVVRAK